MLRASFCQCQHSSGSGFDCQQHLCSFIVRHTRCSGWNKVQLGRTQCFLRSKSFFYASSLWACCLMIFPLYIIVCIFGYHRARISVENQICCCERREEEVYQKHSNLVICCVFILGTNECSLLGLILENIFVRCGQVVLIS